MKSKKIPDDIINKSIEEAQEEVSEILEFLEKEESIDNSLEKYHRLIHLNNYIQQKFKDKSRQIFSSDSKKM